MTTQPPIPCRVLLIDDESFAEELIRHALNAHPDIALHFLARAEHAVPTAHEVQPDVILVDLRMPAIDGFEVIRALRATPGTELVPVILLSSEDDAEFKARAFIGGADDYLVKWPDARELAARLRYHSRAHQARRERDAAFASLRESQQELAQSQAALHQAQKMEAIGQLTGGVAHDFNNVLQIIAGNLQLIKLIGGLSERASSRVDLALAGVERGARLATHLLAFARRQPLQAVVVEPARVLADMAEMMQRTLGERSRVELHIADGLWSTMVDPNQLHNAILNLAINARDAMPDGGTLSIRASNVVDPAGLPDMRPGRHVLIEVADNGHGMAPEVLARAVEPFFTTKPNGEGTGLGLSMVYGFVKQSGGEIVLDSTPGGGTRVAIYLRQCEAAAPSAPAPAPSAIPRGAGTILVVEDEPEVRQTTVELLQALGYQVLSAEDAASAAVIVDAGVAIDLVFTDVVMPGSMSSEELSRRVRAKLPATPVLFTSGYAEGVLAHQGRLDPSISLLQKPYDAAMLGARVHQLLEQAQRGRT